MHDLSFISFVISAGGIETDSITFGPCAELVDEWITVSEREIASALLGISNDESCGPVEGAAAMAMACFIKERKKYTGKSIVIICCGGNNWRGDLSYCSTDTGLRPSHVRGTDCAAL